MQYTDNVASGFWISERLQGWGVVGGTIPRGFEAYARVFHPAEARRFISEDPIEADTRVVTWAEVAAARGATWHLGVWSGWGELHPGSGSWVIAFTRVDHESDGDAQQELEEASRNAVSDDVAHAASIGPTLELPGREYVLLTADVRELTDPSWVSTAGLGWFYRHGPTPNILWPADRAWFLGSEIDFDSTLVGGTRAFIDAIVAHPLLEAAEVTADTDLTINADPINPRCRPVTLGRCPQQTGASNA